MENNFLKTDIKKSINYLVWHFFHFLDYKVIFVLPCRNNKEWMLCFEVGFKKLIASDLHSTTWRTKMIAANARGVYFHKMFSASISIMLSEHKYLIRTVVEI